MSEPLWDRTHPFVIPVTASARHVDGYGHVSTHNYVQWMIDCAFAHSASLGLDEVTCKTMARGMAAISFDVQLLGSAYEGDELEVATWIVDPDGRIRLARKFQIRHPESGRTLARGISNSSVPTSIREGGTHAANLQRDYVWSASRWFPSETNFVAFQGIEALGIPFKSRIIQVIGESAEEFVAGARYRMHRVFN